MLAPVRMPVVVRELPMPNAGPEFRGSWNRLRTGRAIGVATVFDYLEKNFGPAIVPEVLAQTRTHLSWQRLIPDAIGISTAEFEDGWMAHVRWLAGIR
jgi:hypothetical protein